MTAILCFGNLRLLAMVSKYTALPPVSILVPVHEIRHNSCHIRKLYTSTHLLWSSTHFPINNKCGYCNLAPRKSTLWNHSAMHWTGLYSWGDYMPTICTGLSPHFQQQLHSYIDTPPPPPPTPPVVNCGIANDFSCSLRQLMGLSVRVYIPV